MPIRKLYLDTRFRTSGSHAEASFELPQNVEVTNQQSVALGGMSFTNTLDTIVPGNRNLYWLGRTTTTIATDVNDRFYVGWQQESTFGGAIVRLDAGAYNTGTFATLLQSAINATSCPFAVTVSSGSGSPSNIQFDYGATNAMTLPTAAQLSDPAWQASAWKGPAFDPKNTRTINGALSIVSHGTTTVGSYYESPIAFSFAAPTVYIYAGNVAQLDLGYYTGAGFASAVIAAINTVYAGATASYTEPELTIRTNSEDLTFFFPLPEQLRDPAWKASNWVGDDYDVYNPQTINGALSAPTGSPAVYNEVSVCGPLDLATIRELYIHCSLCSYSSLSPSGAQDVIARLVIDVPRGYVQVYRPISPLDSEVSRLTQQSLRNIRIQVRDAYGVVVPLLHHITYELSILETPN